MALRCMDRCAAPARHWSYDRPTASRRVRASWRRSSSASLLGCSSAHLPARRWRTCRSGPDQGFSSLVLQRVAQSAPARHDIGQAVAGAADVLAYLDGNAVPAVCLGKAVFIVYSQVAKLDYTLYIENTESARVLHHRLSPKLATAE